MRGDAYWVATSGMYAVWGFAMFAESLMEDAEVAFEDCDWVTTAECCTETLERLAYCEAAMEGYAGRRREAELLLALENYPSRSAEVLNRLPPVADITSRTAALAILENTRREYERVRNLLPLSLPPLRSPEGLFPTLRVARELAQLRAHLGLPEFPWQWTFG